MNIYDENKAKSILKLRHLLQELDIKSAKDIYTIEEMIERAMNAFGTPTLAEIEKAFSQK